jgi:type III pantothenate kinase
MNLVLDIGNSSVKTGLFEGGVLKDVQTIPHSHVFDYVTEINPNHLIIGSVAKDLEIPASVNLLELTHDTALPIEVNYKTIETLGMDRIAAAVGAQKHNPKGNSLVIDAGSCITYDLLENGNIFQGGIISPGARLRIETMHTHTARLPLISIDVEAEVPLVGKSTKESMQSGVLNGMRNEIDGIIMEYKEKYPDIRVFLCGGEAKYFENSLKEGIFAVPELVLVGLNEILEYNL